MIPEEFLVSERERNISLRREGDPGASRRGEEFYPVFPEVTWEGTLVCVGPPCAAW